MRAMTIKAALLAAVLSSSAFAAMDVEVTENQLSVTCDTSGTVLAKVVAPDDTVVADRQFEGYRFTWHPSGADGAYRYDVRVVLPSAEAQGAENGQAAAAVSEYAGGSLEVRNGKILVPSVK